MRFMVTFFPRYGSNHKRFYFRTREGALSFAKVKEEKAPWSKIFMIGVFDRECEETAYSALEGWHKEWPTPYAGEEG